MDEVTKRSIRELLDRATPGCTIASEGAFLGEGGWGLHLLNPDSTDLQPYICRTGEVTLLPPCEDSAPLTNAELDAVLEAGGFKPADGRTYEEGYADGLADGSQPSINLGFNAGFEEGFDKGINLASKVARIAPGMHPDLAIEAAKKARLAHWESLDQPRTSEPKEASLLAWVAAVSAAGVV